MLVELLEGRSRILCGERGQGFSEEIQGWCWISIHIYISQDTSQSRVLYFIFSNLSQVQIRAIESSWE